MWIKMATTLYMLYTRVAAGADVGDLAGKCLMLLLRLMLLLLLLTSHDP